MSRVSSGDHKITVPYSNSHKAIDLSYSKNEDNNKVLAHTEGTVELVQTGQKNDKGSTGNKSYGNFVKIKHPNGYHTLYAHLDKVYVKKGQKVGTGEVIGTIGNTGNSYGRHLHWEVRNEKDTKVNPTPYLNANLPNSTTSSASSQSTSGKKYIQINAVGGVVYRNGIGFKYAKSGVIPNKTTCELITKNAGKSDGYNWDKIIYKNKTVYIPNKWNKYL